MIYYNDNEIKEINTDRKKLKKVICKGKTIWKSTVIITFIEGSETTEVEYEIGEIVDRSSSPSDAVFWGWSKSASGESPVQNFVATGDATYYRVVKYNDYYADKSVTGMGFNTASSGNFGEFFDGRKYSSAAQLITGTLGNQNTYVNIGDSRLVTYTSYTGEIAFIPANFYGQPNYRFTSARSGSNYYCHIKATGKTTVG